ncbi:MAG: hypothetical protein JXR76_26760 [Deltaproteobacteria bacterium]|nr:hypothetical protein [Deltaproteobacteria bacterium]
MKQRQFPKPLIKTQTYGPLLDAACKPDVNSVRLTVVQQRVSDQITQMERQPTRAFLWTSLQGRKRSLVFAALLLLTVSVGATAYDGSLWKQILGFFDERTDSKLPDAVEAPADTGADATHKRPDGKKRKLNSAGDAQDQFALPSTVVLANIAEFESPIPSDETEPMHSRNKGLPNTDASAVKAAQAQSALKIQIELFNQAKRQSQTAQCADALDTLNRLVVQYPNTRLRADVRRLKLRCLVQLHRYSEASGVATQLIDDPSMAGKKAEHLRILGDLQIHQGRCDLAVQNYHRALGLGLSGRQAEAARNGLKKCNTR